MESQLKVLSSKLYCYITQITKRKGVLSLDGNAHGLKFEATEIESLAGYILLSKIFASCNFFWADISFVRTDIQTDKQTDRQTD